MAEFLDEATADHRYASSGKGNAGLALGIVGTALGALNSGWFGGNGLLGLGGNGNNAAAAGMAAGVAGAELMNGSKAWELERQEAHDQIQDMYLIQDAKVEALKEMAWFREKDTAEKIALRDKIAGVKDFAVTGITDLYRVQNINDKEITKTVDANRYEAMKNLGDTYAATVRADKDLEIQIERNREKDMAEKFSMYKELSDKQNILAYETLKQSYEDRLAASKQTSELANRVCHLETALAVNSARDPLLFQLAEARTQAALNTKVTGNLTINPNQICSNFFGSMPFGIGSGIGTNYGCGCQGNTNI